MILSTPENNIEQSPLPFLKWAGGKRWFIKDYSELFPQDFNTYYEPFLGSGAVFFALQPKKAVLSDTNVRLVETYNAIKKDWYKVHLILKRHHNHHSEEYYYNERSKNRINEFEKAAQFIYLNRTCWNGLYRVNLKGLFNVPIGTKTSVILDSDDFEKTAQTLKNTKIFACDFEETIEKSIEGDFVFVDPPYTVKHNLNGFVKYNEKLFSWDDQIRLQDIINKAIQRNVKVLMSNADHDSIKDLYSGMGKFISLNRPSVISGKALGRGRYSELFIKFWED